MRWNEEDRAAKCINSCSTVEKTFCHLLYSYEIQFKIYKILFFFSNDIIFCFKGQNFKYYVRFRIIIFWFLIFPKKLYLSTYRLKKKTDYQHCEWLSFWIYKNTKGSSISFRIKVLSLWIQIREVAIQSKFLFFSTGF